jgi:phosphoribosylformylglycinamidine cyclo-ligase
VLALPSSGLHSNGYSLARRALLDPAHAGLALHDPLPGGAGENVGAALLVPTTIYVAAFAAIVDLPGAPLHAAAHITGGGLIENPPRVLPDDLAMELSLSAVPRPAIMRAIAEHGVAEAEMRRTFNCGIGMLLCVQADAVADVQRALAARQTSAIEVGRVVRRRDDRPRIAFGQ